MTNQEKAKQLANKYGIKYDTITKEGKIIEMDKKSECYKSAMQMAEWKEQEIIERASLFFIDFFKELPDGPNKFKIKRDCSIEQLIEEFTKAIKD